MRHRTGKSAGGEDKCVLYSFNVLNFEELLASSKQMNLKKLNTAEFFALVRIISFPVVLFFIFSEERLTSAILFLALFSTDAIDGFFAKFFNQETLRRQRLDTNGDVLFLLTGLAGLFVFEYEFFREHLGWLILILILYLSELAICLIKFGQRSYFHTYSAKLAAFFQVFFLAYMLFFNPVEWIFYSAVVLSSIDAIEDIFIALKLKKLRMNIASYFLLE